MGVVARSAVFVGEFHGRWDCPIGKSNIRVIFLITALRVLHRSRSSRKTLFQSIDVESLTEDRYSFEPLEADKDFHVPREAVGTVDSPERFLVNGKISFSSQ